MSILIRGMEMRERCNDQDGHWSCPLFGSVYPHWFFCKVTTKEIDNPFSKQPDCPLVNVPPHGRLVDADALVNKHFGKEFLSKVMTADEDDLRTALVNVPLVINNAPTVIEAEEEVNDI